MKILQASWMPHKASNPFVYTLMDEILSKHSNVSFDEGIDAFMDDKVFNNDIVHIHWPEALILGDTKSYPLEDVKKRIKEIRSKGIKIVCQCHNLEPHYSNDPDKNEIYKFVYSHCDIIIHLGEYSKKLFDEKYPNAENVIIPHHVYDTVYVNNPSKREARKRLGLKNNAKYILCFGIFRGKEEQELISQLAKKIKNKDVYFLAPGFQMVPPKTKLIHYFKISHQLQTFLKYFRHIIITGKAANAVTDEELPYYYAASDLCLIQRKKILNSGNVSLAFLMGKTVVGPNIGNIGPLLKNTGNPTFDVNDDKSILNAVVTGLQLASSEKGEQNRNFAMNNLSTKIIAEKYYNLYKRL